MFRHELVEVIKLDPSIRLDIRYATADNFLGEAVYEEARFFLLEPVARDLIRVHRKLAARGLGILAYDGYRPWAVTRKFWDRVSPADRLYVADPVTGSRHNRGAAVDLTLCDLETGAALPMPSAFDEFTERAWMAYDGGTAEEMANRALLVGAMEEAGFAVNAHEWWHFDHHTYAAYPVLDVAFHEIETTAQVGS